MRHAISTALLAIVVWVGVAGTAAADVCVSIDEPRDTFNSADRSASLILIAREFRQEGLQTGTDNCTAVYVLSHVKLGNVIIVSLSGPNGQREGRALGREALQWRTRSAQHNGLTVVDSFAIRPSSVGR